MTTCQRFDIESIRAITFDNTSDDDPLNFVPAALEAGASEDEAEEIDMILTTRIMRDRGAI